MGNQVSTVHHGLPLRHRRDSDGPTVLPPHVPPGAVAVPPGRLRQVSVDQRLPDTPATFETPPCINIKPSLVASPSPSPPPVPSYLSVSPSSSSCSSVSSPSSSSSSSFPPPPITPNSERWVEEGGDTSVGPRLRQRARTTNNVMTTRARQVPTVFRYCKDPRADAVYLSGTMTGWRCVKMSKPEGETNWVHIHDTREGKHYYKFLVDGHWRVEDSQAKLERDDKVWNVMEVKKSDFEVFDALACDSFSLKTKSKSEKLFNSDSWCQVLSGLTVQSSPLSHILFSFYFSSPRCRPTLRSLT